MIFFFFLNLKAEGNVLHRLYVTLEPGIHWSVMGGWIISWTQKRSFLGEWTAHFWGVNDLLGDELVSVQSCWMHYLFLGECMAHFWGVNDQSWWQTVHCSVLVNALPIPGGMNGPFLRGGWLILGDEMVSVQSWGMHYSFLGEWMAHFWGVND